MVVPERHATAVVTAINFDYRGFDTMGEEFILFAAVLGLALLLREPREERDRPAPTTRSSAGARRPRAPRCG